MASKVGPKPAPANETKADKFKRLGTARLNKALKGIRALQALSNRSQYEFTDEQVRVIKSNLNDAVEQVSNSFAGKPVVSDEISL